MKRLPILRARRQWLLLALAPWLGAAKHDAQTSFARGLDLMCSGGDPKEAAKLFEQAAAQGHRGAQSILGWMHMTGTGVAKSDTLAAPWLRKAAEQGDAAAQNNLGVLHVLGSGVAHDHDQARRWFAAAAQQGARDAQRNLRVLQSAASAPSGRERAAIPTGNHPLLARADCRLRTT